MATIETKQNSDKKKPDDGSSTADVDMEVEVSSGSITSVGKAGTPPADDGQSANGGATLERQREGSTATPSPSSSSTSGNSNGVAGENTGSATLASSNGSSSIVSPGIDADRQSMSSPPAVPVVNGRAVSPSLTRKVPDIKPLASKAKASPKHSSISISSSSSSSIIKPTGSGSKKRPLSASSSPSHVSGGDRKRPSYSSAAASPRAKPSSSGSKSRLSYGSSTVPGKDSQPKMSQFEIAQRKMVATGTSVEELYNIVNNLRERIEIVHTQEYANFLKYLFPAFKYILEKKITVQIKQNVPENRAMKIKNKIRFIILEIINRLPVNNVWFPYCEKILDLVMAVLPKENEANALVCLKIIFELHKANKNQNKMHVQAFLGFVKKLYWNLGATKLQSFQRATTRVETTVPCLYSFPVVTECPLIVMLLYQLHPMQIREQIRDLIPKMIAAIQLKVPPMTLQTSQSKYQMRLLEMVACQVKTLSFLTYLLKSFAVSMKPQSKQIAEAVVYLFKVCPTSATAVRKELFVATRHILATDFRSSFFPFVNELLKEKVLLGSGRQSDTSLRPLAYSTIADLVHHVRGKLKLKQISNIIYIFSRNIDDPMLPLSIQITSVRLLLNLVDNIYHNKEPDRMRGWNLLVRILNTLVNKFSTLKDDIPRIRAIEKAKADASKEHAKHYSSALLKVVKDAEKSSSQRSRPRAAGGSANAAKKTPDAGAASGAATSTADTARGAEPGAAEKAAPSAAKDPSADIASKDPKPTNEEGSMTLVVADPASEAKGAPRANGQPEVPAKSTLPPARAAPGDPHKSLSLDAKTESSKIIKALIKTMILGLKTVVWCVSNYKVRETNSTITRDQRVQKQGVAVPLTEHEITLISNFFQLALACFDVYRDEKSDNRDEEKDVLENFGNVFTVLNHANFRDIFHRSTETGVARSALELLYENMLTDRTLLVIPQLFLTNARMSKIFADILLDFLLEPKRVFYLSGHASSGCSKWDRVDRAEKKLIGVSTDVNGEGIYNDSERANADERAAILLRLFKMVFQSVKLYKDNERVLLPKLRKIIILNLRCVTEVKDPKNHLELLRHLFRSIGGGKFELLYKELLQLLPGLLKGLVAMQKKTDDPDAKRLLIELCLTVPARLPSLLKHLPLLMTPVILALKSVHSELITLALRTLEFWIDNLNTEFLYPIMSRKPILLDLMGALTDLLKPKPANYGTTALRILGKMGGKNRIYLTNPVEFDILEDVNPGLAFSFNFNGAERSGTNSVLKMDKFVDLSTAFLQKHFSGERVPVKGTKTSSNAPSREKTTGDGNVESKIAEKGETSKAPEDAIEFGPKRTIAEIISAGKKAKRRRSKRPKFDDERVRREAAASAKLVAQIRGEGKTPDEQGSETPNAVRVHYKHMALSFLASSLAMFVDQSIGIERMGLESATGDEHGDTLDSSAKKGVRVKQLRAREKTLKKILVGMMTAAADTEMSRKAWPLFRGFVRQLFLLSVSKKGSALSDGHINADPTIICEVLADGWSSGKNEIVEVATRTLCLMAETAKLLCNRKDGTDSDVCRIGKTVWAALLKVLIHASFEKAWKRKVGACVGIRELHKLMPMDWIRANETTMFKALLFVLFDHTFEFQAHVISQAQKTIDMLLSSRKTAKTILAGSNEEGESNDLEPMVELKKQDPSLFRIIDLLTAELVRRSETSRNAAQMLLKRLSEETGISMYHLLVPFRKNIQERIFNRPLNHFMNEEQIARISCATFALSLKGKPLFDVDQSVIKFLMESVHLSSSDRLQARLLPINLDSGGIAVADSATRKILGLDGNPADIVEDLEYPFCGRHRTNLCVYTVGLIWACTVASPTVFADESRAQSRNQCIQFCCRSLTAISPDIVAASKHALGALITSLQKSLPNDLLKTSLRPVLANLAKFDNLTPALLNALAHVLEMLSKAFNDALAKQLLDHLRQWTQPAQIILAGQWEAGKEPEVAAKTIALFQYLPPSVASFMEDLVAVTLKLESVLHRYRTQRNDTKDRTKKVDVSGCGYSPFRSPLTQFLAKYPKQTVEFFLKKERLVNRPHAKLFQAIIKLPEARSIRDELMTSEATNTVINNMFLLQIKTSTDPNAKHGDGFEAISIAPSLPEPSPQDLENARQDLARAQVMLTKARKAYQSSYTKQKKLINDGTKQYKTLQGKLNAAVKKVQDYKHKSYSAKLKDTAHKNVEKYKKELLDSREKLKLAAQKQHQTTKKCEEAVERAERSFEEQQRLVSKVQRRLPVFKCTEEQKNALVSMAIERSPAGQVLMETEEKGAKEKAEYWAKMWANAQLKKARDVIQRQNVRRTADTNLPELNAKPKNKDAGDTSNASTSSDGTTSFWGENGLQNTSAHERKIMELRFQGIKIFHTLSHSDPKWLTSDKKITKCLLMMWEMPGRVERLQKEEEVELRHRQESKLLVECLQNVYRADTSNVSILFRMLNVFTERSVIDYTFLKRFFAEELSKIATVEAKKTLVTLYLEYFNGTKATETLKTLAIQYLLIPVLSAVFADKTIKNSDVLGDDLIKKIVSSLVESSASNKATEKLLVELLKLATLLVEFMSSELTVHRKNLIKFAWNHLKSKDALSKNWAYINVCRFIAMYETPPKIILQVYVALLRMTAPESRPLVRKALDILVPVLKDRLPHDEFVKSIKWTKKVIYEDGHSLSNVIHVWGVIVKNPSMFYGHKEQFMPQMVNCLSRLALPGNATLENRSLAVDLVEIIIVWEIEREKRSKLVKLQDQSKSLKAAARLAKKEAKLKLARKQARIEKKRKAAGKCPLKLRKASQTKWVLSSERKPSKRYKSRPISRRNLSYPKRPFSSLQSMGPASRPDKSITMIINFLIRLSLSTVQVGNQDILWRRCTELLARGLSVWPLTSIKNFSFKKLLEVPQKSSRGSSNRGRSTGSDNSSYPSTSKPKGRGAAGKAKKGSQRSTAATRARQAVDDVTSASQNIKPGVLLACLEVLNTMLRFSTPAKKNKFIQSNIAEIMTLLEPCLRTISTVDYGAIKPSQLEIGESANNVFSFGAYADRDQRNFLEEVILLNKCFRRFITRLIFCFPMHNAPKEFTDCRFYGYFKDLLDKSVTAGISARTKVTDFYNKYGNSKSGLKPPSGKGEAAGRFTGFAALQCISVLAKAHSPTALMYIGFFNKVLEALALDRTAFVHPSKDEKGRKISKLEGPTEGAHAFKLAMGMIGKSISRIHDKPDKRYFLNTLSHVIHKNDNTFVLEAIVSLVSNWMNLSVHLHTPLNDQEKEAFLIKMFTLMRFRDQHHALPLLTKYFDIIYSMCSLPEDSRPDWLNVQLKRPFMSALFSPNPIQRRMFYKLYVAKLNRDGKLHSTFSRVLSTLVQDWEPVNNRFWLPLATECILAGRVETSSISLDSSTPGFAPIEEAPEGFRLLGKGNTTTELTAMIAEQSAFLQSVRGNMTVKRVLTPLHELSHADPRVAIEMWGQVYPAAWASLDERSQMALVRPLTSLLSQQYHKRQLRLGSGFGYRRNVVQALLLGLAKSNPAPLIPAELLMFLGKTYNAWHTAIRICERQVFERDNHTQEGFESWTRVLDNLYTSLNETDHSKGLRHLTSESRETTAALDLQANGQWKQSQEVLVNAISEHMDGRLSEFELAGWKSSWVESCRQLAQWDVLLNYCLPATNEPKVLLECAWKTPKWSLVKKLFASPSVKAVTEETTPDSKLLLYQIYLAIQEWKLSDVDQYCRHGVQLVLQKWQSLPSTTSAAHIPLLQTFQNLVEVQESSKILVELKETRERDSSRMPDLNKYMHVWRERLPNRWEDAVVWTDVLTWRMHMFDFIKSESVRRNQRSRSKQDQSGQVQDTPWTALKICEVARNHKLKDLGLKFMDKLSNISQMEIGPAFKKLQQQISLCLDEPLRLKNGLAMINNTNLSYFQSEQKAELFRLKALFLERLGETREAESAFSKCLNVCQSFGEGWLSWGQFYDRLLHIACRGESAAVLREDASLELGAKTLEGLPLEYACHVMSCYLHAIYTRKEENTQLLLARVLRLLQCDDPSGRLLKIFTMHVDDTPIWSWVVWIPQLISMLGKEGSGQAHRVLTEIAKRYPQALYYSLRAFLLECRSEERSRQKKGAAAAPPADESDPARPKSAAKFAEELMNTIKRSHSPIAFEIESLLEELIVKFKQGPEEELLYFVHGLFAKCMRLQLKESTMGEVGVPNSIRVTLERITARFFPSEARGLHPRHAECYNLYAAAFRKDFSMSSRPRMSVEGLVRKLSKWKYIINNHLDQSLSRLSGSMNMEDCSSKMVAFSSQNIELPGQYSCDSEPNLSQNVTISLIETDYSILRRSDLSHTHQCRISIRGSDGLLNNFLLQNTAPKMTPRDERVAQFFELTNRLMAVHAPARQRNVRSVVPVIVPITPRIRLLKECSASTSLSSVYEDFCAAAGVDEVLPFIMAKNASVLSHPDFLFDGSPAEARAANRVRTYRTICETLVPNSILTDRVSALADSYEKLWYIRKQFATQTAVISYLSYLLSMGHQEPHKMFVSAQSGTTMYSDLHPLYSPDGLFASTGAVPFRLTRSMAHFLTPAGIHGTLTNSMMAVGSALKENEAFFEDYLFLLLQDDMEQQRAAIESSHAAETAKGEDGEEKKKEKDAVVDTDGDAIMGDADAAMGDGGPKGSKTIPYNVSVVKNMYCVLDRLDETTPINIPAVHDRTSCLAGTRSVDNPACMNGRIRDLLNDAMDVEKLASMPASWQPWL